MRSPPSVATGLFAGRYAIEREIGQGASAKVYLARDTQAGSAVALKILRRELVDSRASGRFLKEIRRTSTLEHSNIVRVLDSGEHEGQLYFALPYMEAGTLRHLLLRDKRPMEFDRIVEMARAIAEALDHAHGRGLIHLDVKPENILFTNGRPMLADFGIARAIYLSGSGSTDSTSRTTIRGTPAYMSPEQAAGATDLDGRSDVFSFACVIYEMITGMQAYMGPTEEAVLAQRFLHMPRDPRVFRPTVPVTVNSVLQRAFAVTPADRYRTASELVESVATALATHTSVERHPVQHETSRVFRPRAILSVVAGVAVLGIAAWVVIPPEPPPRTDATDTTRVVLLPIERDVPSLATWRAEDLLHQAFARWRDIQIVDQFQVADAVQRHGEVRSNDDAQRVARALGAGRWVRARLTPLGPESRLSASLYEVGHDTPLYVYAETVPDEIGRAAAAFVRIADSLLLRGRTADPLPAGIVGSRSLPAQQAFAKGQDALTAWDLVRADSGFASAVQYDPEFTRASFWLAQVRAWRGMPVQSWRAVVERAASRQQDFNDRERQLVAALLALSHGSFGDACRLYGRLISRDGRDFAAWFGRGQCIDMDDAVLPDSSSPSSWRFRASYYRAALAYRNALTLLPIAHRGLEQFSYSRLQRMLHTSQIRYRPGTAAHSDTLHFFARGAWRGDSVVFVPYPVDRIPAVTLEQARDYRRAAEFGRSLFREVTGAWVASLPGSVGAKEAFAVSLEMDADAAAIDTLRSARAHATSDDVRRRLAAKEAVLHLKFGFPDDDAGLTRARRLADSIAVQARPGAMDLATAASVAALRGDCARVGELKRAAADARVELIRAPRQLVGEWESAEAQVAMGCRPESSLAQLNARIWGPEVQASASQRRQAEAAILARIVLLGAPYDSAWIDRLAPNVTGPLFAALHAAMRGDEDRARSLLAFNLEARLPGELSPDAILPRANVWLMIGDTSSAVVLLDRLLADVRYLTPGLLESPVQIGALLRLAQLRSDIAAARNDTVLARRLRNAVNSLWSGRTFSSKTPHSTTMAAR
jgi:tRNA A-37 threonylcarbamoyl transferase component Bud32